MIYLLIGCFFFGLFKYYRKVSDRRFVEKLMQESIDTFEQKNPEVFKKIKLLNKDFNDNIRLSNHMGSIRDGSESDRNENIRQDKKVNSIREKLLEEVERSHFIFTLRDVLRKYGDDEKLTLKILNYQSGSYTGTEVTLLSKTDIGFKSIPADRIFKNK
tara:strand:+ start:87 stop:563 length:477 start_codon:yes stop_codon:yes gene_type:complete